jgi:hypothetical protein
MQGRISGNYATILTKCLLNSETKASALYGTDEKGRSIPLIHTGKVNFTFG